MPEAIAVLALSKRYPGEGGVYLWAARAISAALHGFIAGWCYWTNSLFYVPVLLVYLAGVLAFAGGDARPDWWTTRGSSAASPSAGWRSSPRPTSSACGVGKWINNIGGVGRHGHRRAGRIAGLSRARGAWRRRRRLVEGTLLDMASGLSVMCFAFIGIELASTMADEIRDPRRDVPRAIVIIGVISLVVLLAVTDALLALVPSGELGAIQGVMQGVSRGASAIGASWLVAPIAVVMSLAVGGAASAWLAGPARIPFVAGLDRALPAALGRVHPRWGSPHIALITCGVVSAVLTALSLPGRPSPRRIRCCCGRRW